jgi:hypothetical protein
MRGGSSSGNGVASGCASAGVGGQAVVTVRRGRRRVWRAGDAGGAGSREVASPVTPGAAGGAAPPTAGWRR